jgi:hypothetical protein
MQEYQQELGRLPPKGEDAELCGMQKKGAGDCKPRHQKPRPQICVVSKVTFG